MARYVLSRIVVAIPTMIAISFIVFALISWAPGSPTASMTDEHGVVGDADSETVRKYYSERYGLDKPFLYRYFRWLNAVSPVGFTADDPGFSWPPRLKLPDLGDSMHRQRPIDELLLESLPVTITLNAISVILIYLIAIPSGLFAASAPRSKRDQLLGAFFLTLWCIPALWAGVMLIGLLANRQYLAAFPSSGLHSIGADEMQFLPIVNGGVFERGWTLDTLWHMALPLICLSYGGFAYLSKLTRAAVIEQLGALYVRTVRAKGLSITSTVYKHVLPNSLLPVITVTATVLPGLFAGSIVVETVFGIPGMGQLAVEAARYRDSELIMAIILVVGAVGLSSEILRDLCYALADPRVRFSGKIR